MRDKKMWQKIISVLLCAGMTLGLCACGGSPEESSASGGKSSEAGDVSTGTDESEKEESGGAGEEREPITLTFMGDIFSDGISTDDAVGRYIQEKLGITIEYQVATDDRMNVLMAGGDLPDFMNLRNVGSQLSNMIESGMLWRMDDWLAEEENGKNIKNKMHDGLIYSREIMGGGSTYFLPTGIQTANKSLPSQNGNVGFFTRWDYYKELGYPEVSNPDELLNVWKQMVDAHPETPDGKKTYALSGWTDWGLWPFMISYPFSFGYSNSNNNQMHDQVNDVQEDMFVDGDGIFWEALAWWNRAYRMGIVDPEIFTMKYDQYRAKIQSGEVLVCAYNWDQPDKSIYGEEAEMFMIPGPFPYASQIYPVEQGTGQGVSNALVISSNCKYPERVMELLDFLDSDEGARLVWTGIQGVDWDYVDGVPQMIGTRLENFLDDTVEPGYADVTGAQGIGRYSWMTSMLAMNSAEDGYPLGLNCSKEYLTTNVGAGAKDFCEHYTGGEAKYPGEVYVKLVDDGVWNTVEKAPMTAALTKPVSEESRKIFSKAMEYFTANIAKVVTAKDDAAFEAQKQKMIDDIMAMGYEKALAEHRQLFEEARTQSEIFND